MRFVRRGYFGGAHVLWLVPKERESLFTGNPESTTAPPNHTRTRSRRRAAKPQQRRDRLATASLARAVREATKGAIAGGHEHRGITAESKGRLPSLPTRSRKVGEIPILEIAEWDSFSFGTSSKQHLLTDHILPHLRSRGSEWLVLTAPGTA